MNHSRGNLRTTHFVRSAGSCHEPALGVYQLSQKVSEMDFTNLRRTFSHKRRRRQAASSPEPLEHRVLLTAEVANDFNGDGYDDIAVAVLENLKGLEDAGAVHVIYGSADGFDEDQFWHPDVPGIKGKVRKDALFGNWLDTGDFNGDGFGDLAISSNNAVVGGVEAGAVHILYGSAGGLTAAGNQYWHQNSRGIKERSEEGNAFGAGLSAGDFDGDGHDDLAIAAPGESVGSITGAGAVHILYGTDNGLSAERNQLWHQNSPGIAEVAEEQDLFGVAMTSGDFDGDGTDDLAVGVPLEDIGEIKNAGVVNVLYGTQDVGLTAAGDRLLHQNIKGINEVAEAYDGFGMSLTTGDFDGSGHDDLAVGVPGESVSGIEGAGGVNVIYGSSNGLRPANDQFWSQNSSGIKDRAEDVENRELAEPLINHEQFGTVVAAGDFDNNGTDDLAIGVPGEMIRGNMAGAVHVIYSNGNGLHRTGNQLFHQNTPGMPEVSEGEDLFGASLGVLDFDNQNGDDLVIGAPGESIKDVREAGAGFALYSGDGQTGLQIAGWGHQDKELPDKAERFDHFGTAMPGSTFLDELHLIDNPFDD